MFARQRDEIIILDIDENLQGPKMYLCANFGCSIYNCVGVCRQIEEIWYYSLIFNYLIDLYLTYHQFNIWVIDINGVLGFKKKKSNPIFMIFFQGFDSQIPFHVAVNSCFLNVFNTYSCFKHFKIVFKYNANTYNFLTALSYILEGARGLLAYKVTLFFFITEEKNLWLNKI